MKKRKLLRNGNPHGKTPLKERKTKYPINQEQKTKLSRNEGTENPIQGFSDRPRIP